MIVDTTGAGDCFTAAFTTRLMEGANVKESMEFANKAAYLCITEFGALPS
jgi:ribokinase